MPELRITADMLVEQGACEPEVERFREAWPRGALVRWATVQKAARHGFDLYWFARKFLSAPAWAEFDKAEAAAWAEYNKAVAPAWAEYNKAVAPALWEALQSDKAAGRGLWGKEGK